MNAVVPMIGQAEQISPPEWSGSIGTLVGALAKAQGRITGALKDSANPFFKSKYADLAACWMPVACRCRRTSWQ